MSPTAADVEAQLCGPGGPFEVVTEKVGGLPMKVYKSRFPHLRAVAEAAAGRGDETFIVFGDDRVGFGPFFEQANALAAGLASIGITKGDRVAVLSANNPEWCMAFWATVSLGGVLVGLNGWWKTDEILYGLQDSGAKVLVADRDRFARIVDDLDDLVELETVILIDAPENEFGADARTTTWAAVTGDAAGFPDVDIDEDDPALIFYTSGTTGRPKGAISTHRNMIANLQNTLYNAIAMRTKEPESVDSGGGATVSLMTSPLFHVAGLHSSLVVGTLAGVRMVMTKGRFDPRVALELIEREKVTIWATVPTMVWRVCESPHRADYDTSTITTVAFGGSPASDELRRMIRDTFPNVRSQSNVYGLTESNSAATIINGRDYDERPGSVGRPVPVVDLRITDANGDDLGPGETGEILIKGPIITPGYWGKPEATAAVIVDGWLHTGDIGHLDEDGYLYITDRAKDVIIRGGENVYSVEIEQRLVEHPEILDAGVVGIPHPSLGEEVKAVVQTAPGSPLDADAVRSWVRETLADFKVPAHVELTTEQLPRNPSGKLLKNVLRGEAENQFMDSL